MLKMFNNKKGYAGIVAGVILAVITVLLTVNLLIPQVRTLDTLSAGSDSATHVYGAGNTTLTLSESAEAGSISIAGLNLSNYSVTNSVINIFNTTGNGTYTAVYTYQGTQYLSNGTQRTLAGVIGLGAIIGLLVLILRVFGAI